MESVFDHLGGKMHTSAVFLLFLLKEAESVPVPAVGFSPLSVAVSEITLLLPIPYSLPRDLA